MSSKRRALVLFLALLSVVLTVNLIRSWLHLSSRGDILEETRKKLESLQAERENLQRKLAGVQTREYIEQQARDKLNLGKDKEVIILMPPVTPAMPTPSLIDRRKNWEKWKELFFN